MLQTTARLATTATSSARVDRRSLRKSAVVGGMALAMGLLGSTGAWAQCRDNFNFVGLIAGVTPVPVSTFVPLGTGSALSALTSTINTVNTAFLTSTSAFVSAPGGAQPDQQGGGAWGRVIAGTVDTNTQSVGTLDTSRVAVALPPATGRQVCDTTTRSDYWGYQVGHDISILNGGGTGALWHCGVTAGYLEARTKDITPGGSYFHPLANFPAPGTFFTPAGTFSEDAQVPFAGIYTAFTKGNLALDGQVRADFHQNRISEPINGLFSQQLNARGLSLTGNAAYNIPLQSNWFIEPGVGVVWSRVETDPLNVPGIAVTGGVIARGTVTIEDIESVLGRASISVGTSFTHGGVTWQPFFTASVFHEFSGDVTARSTIAGTGNANIENLQLTLNSSGGVGTYGQFALGTAAVLGTTGWLGYARTDYRIGDNIDGWSVNAGLRYQFTPGQRGSIKDGPAPAVYAYNWTGPYVGTFVGTTWGDENWRLRDGRFVDPDYAGYIAGAQAGYNVQFGSAVIGVEGDYGFANAKGGKSCPARPPSLDPFIFTCQADVDNLASITGRVGFTWGRALFYGKAGWAGGDVTAGTTFNSTGVKTGTDTNWRNGWTAGGGMEFALTDRWSAKAEWMYYDLGKDTYIVQSTNPLPPGGAVVVPVDAHTEGNIVRIGINYHFAPRCCDGPLK